MASNLDCELNITNFNISNNMQYKRRVTFFSD